MIRHILVGNFFLCIQYAVGGLIPIVLIPHIVRAIGLTAYGDLAVALVWASYGAVLVQYAFQLTGPRRLMQLQPGETARTVFKDIASAKAMLLVPAMACMCLAAASFSSGKNTNAQLTLLVLLPVGAALHTGWHLQTAGRFFWLCSTSIVGASVTLMIGFALVNGDQPASVLGASVALGAGPLFVGVATFIVSILILRDAPPTVRSMSPVNALYEGWPLFISQFTAALYSASGPLVIRYASSVEAAGAYSTVERIVTAVMGACLLTHTAAYPRLAALYGSNRENYWRLMRFIIAAYLASSILIVVSILFTRQAFIKYLFGEEIPNNVNALIGSALVWLLIGIVGPALTGYLTVSGQQSQVWPLTLRVLCVALLVGIPGCFLFGAWAWMGALVVSQVPVFLAVVRAWRENFILEDR